MDLRQDSQPFVPVAFRKGHCHRVSVERKTKNPRTVQLAPHYAAASFAAHKPFKIRFLGVLAELPTCVGFRSGTLLASNVCWVECSHARTLGGCFRGTCTP